MKKMEQPKEALGPIDKNGFHVPLNTRMLYDKNGEGKTVTWFLYSPGLNHWMAKLDEGPNVVASAVAVSNLYRDPVDSWEKLEEDLGRVASYDKDCSPVCAYTRQPCAVCKFHSSEECTGAMCVDIASRIRKLRGKD